MNLRSLLESLHYPEHSALALTVENLRTDSRQCHPGDLFIGMPGTQVDGGTFWRKAMDLGAIAAIVSEAAFEHTAAERQAWQAEKGEEPCLIPVQDVAAACAQLAARFYDYPAQKVALVGVTGTNGKTTSTHLIEYFLQQHQALTGQATTGLLGTLYTRWPGFSEVAAHTTPFATTLQGQLQGAVQAGCTHVVMEVSSHALDQHRVAECPFAVSVFTNLTQDHLDYHVTMEAYFEAKARLFSPAYLKGTAVINRDDPYGRRLIERIPAEQVLTYSATEAGEADLWVKAIDYGAQGVTGTLVTPQGEYAFQSPLVGSFNVANVLAAIGAGIALKLSVPDLLAALPQFAGVPGRMERVEVSPEQDITVIVDYAHTPDSLENLLKAARPFVPGQMICVFGCGGDRDRTKRPKMGKIAAELADQAIVTSDNPRTEDPQRILEDVVEGIADRAHTTVIGDRAEAIRFAIAQAQAGDGVLIAGKGHEDYQILGTEKIHFDDREQAREALQQRF
jgi:UDP-N-acetylmuramoyl-L-alanyl-D-glutamate--2,6-diaminopimelate ligase